MRLQIRLMQENINVGFDNELFVGELCSSVAEIRIYFVQKYLSTGKQAHIALLSFKLTYYLAYIDGRSKTSGISYCEVAIRC